MTGIVQVATVVTALGCGLAAGVWFAFSSFVMPALDRLPSDQGIAAMQSINRLAVTPVFMTALFGTALACVGLAAWAVVSFDRPEAKWVLAGAALYVVGTIVVTIAANVPLNDSLESVRPQAAGAVDQWSSYVRDWTAWNHLRAVTSLGAAGLLTVALLA